MQTLEMGFTVSGIVGRALGLERVFPLLGLVPWERAWREGADGRTVLGSFNGADSWIWAHWLPPTISWYSINRVKSLFLHPPHRVSVSCFVSDLATWTSLSLERPNGGKRLCPVASREASMFRRSPPRAVYLRHLSRPRAPLATRRDNSQLGAVRQPRPEVPLQAVTHTERHTKSPRQITWSTTNGDRSLVQHAPHTEGLETDCLISICAAGRPSLPVWPCRKFFNQCCYELRAPQMTSPPSHRLATPSATAHHQPQGIASALGRCPVGVPVAAATTPPPAPIYGNICPPLPNHHRRPPLPMTSVS